ILFIPRHCNEVTDKPSAKIIITICSLKRLSTLLLHPALNSSQLMTREMHKGEGPLTIKTSFLSPI
ncbi:MAG: hypothetical protein SO214_06700, partial [Prevotella pectinovora]|uniref:hypothetical protein n=1 Tax=Prevotella pectinovora TaxID=1602169 RepID=UPI002A80660F